MPTLSSKIRFNFRTHISICKIAYFYRPKTSKTYSVCFYLFSVFCNLLAIVIYAAKDKKLVRLLGGRVVLAATSLSWSWGVAVLALILEVAAMVFTFLVKRNDEQWFRRTNQYILHLYKSIPAYFHRIFWTVQSECSSALEFFRGTNIGQVGFF